MTHDSQQTAADADAAPTLICLAGPTASGKSAASLALAQQWPIELIIMDSATIYRGMDIGTAKPAPQEQAQVPHHLLDIRDPAQSYSAAEFAQDAAALARQIRARGRLPVLCGGTMLYYKALREGLNDLPLADPAIRQALDAEARERGWPALHADLAQVDPVTAARLAPNDSQRLQRALEIWHGSGRTLSDWLAQPPTPVLQGWRFVTISLEPSGRAVLHARIAERYRTMLDMGLLDEVRVLHKRPDLHPGLPAIRCVGYRQLWAHLDGRVSLNEAVEQAIAATRQLAKRQITWLRGLPERRIVDCLSERATQEVVQHCSRVLAADHSPR